WGISESCGCLRAEQVSARFTKLNWKHGHTVGGKFSPEYRTWQAMLRRCEYPSSHRAPWSKYYAAQGVRVCRRWKTSFETFLADLGPKPSPSHSIDRYP